MFEYLLKAQVMHKACVKKLSNPDNYEILSDLTEEIEFKQEDKERSDYLKLYPKERWDRF